MLSNFSYAFNAIAPILIVVLLGYYLRQKNVFSPEFFKTTSRFAFHYTFPAMMFVNLYSLGSIRDIDLKLAGLIMFSIVLITLLSLLLTHCITPVRKRKGVLVQAGFRSNFAIIGLPLAEGLLGSEGLMMATTMQLPVVIYFNFVSVFALTIFSDDAKADPKKILRGLVKNPLIQGLTLGALALILREFIPRTPDGNLVFSLKGNLPWVYTAATYLNRIATPLALITMGGQFSFSDVSRIRKELFCGTVMRLILAPVIGFAIAFTTAKLGLYTLTPAAIAVMIPAFGSPIAISSAVMAAEMQADDVLAGQLVVWTSFISMFTIFLQVVLFRSLGLL